MISLIAQEPKNDKLENAKLEELDENRPGLDLICVIDKSGSMQG